MFRPRISTAIVVGVAIGLASGVIGIGVDFSSSGTSARKVGVGKGRCRYSLHFVWLNSFLLDWSESQVE